MNITLFTCQDFAEQGIRACLAVPLEQASLAYGLAQKAAPAGCALVSPAVGLTLYPKGAGLDTPISALAALAKAGISPLCLGTSLSALTLVLPAEECQAAREVLAERFQLIPQAGPPAQTVRVVQTPVGMAGAVPRQTVAVYAEDPVRTYGLKVRKSLGLVSALCPGDRLESLAEALCPEPGPTQTAWCAASSQGDKWRLTACLPWETIDRISHELLKAGLGAPEPASLVSLIHLQGPHFGDRYGILAAALGALDEARVPPLAICAVVHSVFLSFRPGQGEGALTALRARFCGPEPK